MWGWRVVREGILNRASLPSATRGGPRVSLSWCFPLAPQPRSSGCSEGLTPMVQLLLLFFFCCCCSGQRSGARGTPRDRLKALELVFIPRPDRLRAHFVLVTSVCVNGVHIEHIINKTIVCNC